MSKYNPMSKEFQDDARRLGLTGYQLAQKYIKEGKLPDLTENDRNRRKKFLKERGFKNEIDYLEYLAKNKGFKNRKEQRRKIYEDDIGNNRNKNKEWHYTNKGSSPMSEDANCPSFTGVFLGENIIGKTILIEIFGNIEKEMIYGKSGYDYIVRRGYKVEVKTGKLLPNNRWSFNLKLNNIADYFLIIALNNTRTEIIHVWSIKKDDIIKKRIGDYYKELKIWKLDHLGIGNNTERLLEFEEYEITDKLICKKEINDKLCEIENYENS